MATLVQRRVQQSDSDVAASGAPRLLLLASDGSPAAEAATRVAAAVAAQTACDVRVVSVMLPQLYPPPAFDAGIGVGLTASLMESDLKRRQAVIERQITDVQHAPWPLDLEVGPPATIIAREARRREAFMVVMGLREHSTIERWLRDETTLRVVRESPVPVLAVTSALTRLPSRVAVAVDFSRASLRAARAAVDLIAPDGTLYVVYVGRPFERTEEAEGANVIHSQGLTAAFARLRREIRVPRGIHVEAVLLEGEPAAELISFADRAGIDLIAIGSHKHPFLTRMLVGSVTTALVRSARHSMLVAPPMREGAI